MSDELRENVVRAIRHGGKTWPEAADAAIALVLEEAAKVVDVMSGDWSKARMVGLADDVWLKGMVDGAEDIAAAIRALKGKP